MDSTPRHYDDDDDPFADLRGMSVDELEAEGDRLRAEIVNWSDRRSDTDPRGYNRAVARASEIHRRIEQHEAASEQVSRGRGMETAFGGKGRGSSRSRSRDALTDLDPTQVVRMGHAEARDHALRALESRGRKLAPDQQDQVDELLRSTIGEDNPNVDGSYIAKRTLITESDAYRSAWKQLVTEPHPLLTNAEIESVRALKALDVEYRAMGENVTTAGGFGVPVFLDPSIILTGQGSENPFWELAKNVQVTSNIWKGVSSAGVSWSFDTEGSAVSDDSPTLAQPTVTVHMARGFIPFSIEVGQDYPGFAEEMSQLLAAGYDDLLLNKFTRGSGTGEPQGILTALSANTNVRVTVTTAPTIGAPDPYKVWKALPQRYRSRAKWLMSVGVNVAMRQVGTDAQLHALTVQLPNETMDTLFNRAVYESPYMPDTTTFSTATSGYAIVGSFENFVLARRAGLSVELVQHLVDVTSNRPTGSRGWFAWGRVGSASANDLGFRLLVAS